MFIPVDSDVPLKTFPYVTLGLIAVNVLAFFNTGGWENVEPDARWVLSFEAIHPVQWLTHAFMHLNVTHLVGNMFFLWTFGMIVEGKLGSPKFLVVYLVIAVLNGLVLQLPMLWLSGEGGALGASGVIFGLMAMALLWTPESEVECVMLLPPLHFHMPMLVFVGLYFLLQIFGIALTSLTGFRLSSEILHVIGLTIGAPIGVALLFARAIDPHGQDVFSKYVLDQPLGTPLEGEPHDYVAAAMGQTQPSEVPTIQAEPDELRVLVRALWGAIETNSLDAANGIYGKLRSKRKLKALSQETISAVARLRARAHDWEGSVATLQELTRRPPEVANPALLQIARIQMNFLNDPRAAKASLKKLRRASPELLERRAELLAAVGD